jgi:hypothetical protein
MFAILIRQVHVEKGTIDMFEWGHSILCDKEHNFLLNDEYCLRAVDDENFGKADDFIAAVKDMRKERASSLQIEPLPLNPTSEQYDEHRVAVSSNLVIVIPFTNKDSYCAILKRAVQEVSLTSVVPSFCKEIALYVHVQFSRNVITGHSEAKMARSGRPTDAKPGSVGNRDMSEAASFVVSQLFEIVDGSDEVPQNIEPMSFEALGWKGKGKENVLDLHGRRVKFHNLNCGGGGPSTGANGICIMVTIFGSKKSRVLKEDGVNRNSREMKEGKVVGKKTKKPRKPSTPNRKQQDPKKRKEHKKQDPEKRKKSKKRKKSVMPHVSGKNGASNKGGWLPVEQKLLYSGLKQFNVPKYGRWNAIARIVKTRTGKQIKDYVIHLKKKAKSQGSIFTLPLQTSDPPAQKQGSEEEDEEMELGEEEQQQQQEQDNAAINWARCEDCDDWRILDAQWHGISFRCCDVPFSCVDVDDEAP